MNAENIVNWPRPSTQAIEYGTVRGVGEAEGYMVHGTSGILVASVAFSCLVNTGSGGSTLASRVDATGYGWSALGENIAAGPMTVNAVMDGWMTSDGHFANIMNPSFTQIGQAAASGAARRPPSAATGR